MIIPPSPSSFCIFLYFECEVELLFVVGADEYDGLDDEEQRGLMNNRTMKL